MNGNSVMSQKAYSIHLVAIEIHFWILPPASKLCVAFVFNDCNLVFKTKQNTKKP